MTQSHDLRIDWAEHEIERKAATSRDEYRRSVAAADINAVTTIQRNISDLPDVASLMPIVVGAHISSEIFMRPLAAELLEHILRLQAADADAAHPRAVVCTDVWFLNDAALMARPAIAIGPPAWNAATAYYAPRLPTAVVVDERWRIHLDPEFIDLTACLWGDDPSATAEALDVFVEKHLPELVRWAGEPVA